MKILNIISKIDSIFFSSAESCHIVINFILISFIANSNEEDSIRKQKLPDLKFTYIISCQIYGNLKRSKDPRQKDILNLMIT